MHCFDSPADFTNLTDIFLSHTVLKLIQFCLCFGMSGRREFFHTCNTLSCIPQILVGRNIHVILRNETSVIGKLVSCDGLVDFLENNPGLFHLFTL